MNYLFGFLLSMLTASLYSQTMVKKVHYDYSASGQRIYRHVETYSNGLKKKNETALSAVNTITEIKAVTENEMASENGNVGPDNALIIFPNPFSGVLNVKLEDLGTAKVGSLKILNMEGKEIYYNPLPCTS